MQGKKTCDDTAKADAVATAIARIKRNSSAAPEVESLARTAIRLGNLDLSLQSMSRFITVGMTSESRRARGFDVKGKGRSQRIVWLELV